MINNLSNSDLEESKGKIHKNKRAPQGYYTTIEENRDSNKRTKKAKSKALADQSFKNPFETEANDTRKDDLDSKIKIDSNSRTSNFNENRNKIWKNERSFCYKND